MTESTTASSIAGGDDSLWSMAGFSSLHTRVAVSEAWPTVPGGRCVDVRFDSASHEGRPSQIFALASLQRQPAEAPLMLLVHGGGGTCESFVQWRVEPHLRNGFNVLALDLPGKGDRRESSRSTGPHMNHGALFRADDARSAYPWHAVMAIRRTLDMAAEQGWGNGRVLLEGWSWGAVLGLLTGSIDARIDGVAGVYGAGHLRRGSIGYNVARMGNAAAAKWRAWFDPAEQACRDDLWTYLVAASNDEFFALPDNVRTWMGLPMPHRHWTVMPNVNHKVAASAHGALDLFAQSVASGARVPGRRFAGVESGVNGVRLLLEGSDAVLEANAYVAATLDAGVSSAGDADGDIACEAFDWTRVRWRPCPTATLDDRVIVAAQDIQDQFWFVTLVCEGGMLASSPLFHGHGARLLWAEGLRTP